MQQVLAGVNPDNVPTRPDLAVWPVQFCVFEQ